MKGLGEHFIGQISAAFLAGEGGQEDGVSIREVVSIEGCKPPTFVSNFTGCNV